MCSVDDIVGKMLALQLRTGYAGEQAAIRTGPLSGRVRPFWRGSNVALAIGLHRAACQTLQPLRSVVKMQCL